MATVSASAGQTGGGLSFSHPDPAPAYAQGYRRRLAGLPTRGLPRATHLAFADEASYLKGRYRGLCVVSMERGSHALVAGALSRMITEAGSRELKWWGVNGRIKEALAKAVIDMVVQWAASGVLRVDCLTWDTHDYRHAVARRDDIQNLHRMYHHLLRNVLRRRWGSDTSWLVVPDENSAMDWTMVQHHLERKSGILALGALVPGVGDLVQFLVQEFKALGVMPKKSEREPLIQVADLICGLGVYSRACYDKVEDWKRVYGRAPSMFGEEIARVDLSGVDMHRCPVVDHFYEQCKRFKLGISLPKTRGLRTVKPTYPVNFWWYEPQHDGESAPVRQT